MLTTRFAPLWDRRRIWVSLLIVGMVSAGCGSRTLQSGVEGSATTFGSSPSTAQDEIGVSSYALNSTLYLSGNIVTLSPPGPKNKSTSSPSSARAAITGSGLYTPDLEKHSSSGLKFALFTDLGQGPNPPAGHKFQPTYVKHPVWYIDYHDVQWAPSGPAPKPGSTAPSSPALVTTDEFFVVDAFTGKMIEMIDTDPSSTPPSSTSVSPAQIKASS